MQKRRGFTAVELAVVMVVIGILLTIAVLSYRHTQAVARDRERDADVQAIATYLEGMYMQQVVDPANPSISIKQIGSYPAYFATPPAGGPTSEAERQYYDAVYGDLARGAIYAPGMSTSPAFMRSSNGAVNMDTVTPRDRLDAYSAYIYTPLMRNGALCLVSESTCASFKIHYRTELGGYKTVESKRKS